MRSCTNLHQDIGSRSLTVRQTQQVIDATFQTQQKVREFDLSSPLHLTGEAVSYSGNSANMSVPAVLTPNKMQEAFKKLTPIIKKVLEFNIVLWVWNISSYAPTGDASSYTPAGAANVSNESATMSYVIVKAPLHVILLSSNYHVSKRLVQMPRLCAGYTASPRSATT